MNKEQVIDNIKIMIQATVEAKRNYEECLEGFTKELFLDTFTYEDKGLLDSFRAMMNSIGYSAQNRVDEALMELKKQAHPEVEGVKYYKKYIDRLSIDLTEDYDENHPTSYARLEEGRNHQRIFTPKVKCVTGIIYMTVWNTETYKDYQGHNIVELRDDIKSEHTRKAADWIMETLGEGDHRCIVKVDLIGEDVSFELIDSKTLEG